MIAYYTLVCVCILVAALVLVAALAWTEGRAEHGTRCRCNVRPEGK